MKQKIWQPKRTLAPWHTLISSILQKRNANAVQVNNGSSLVINFSYNAIGNDIDHPISFEYLTALWLCICIIIFENLNLKSYGKKFQTEKA